MQKHIFVPDQLQTNHCALAGCGGKREAWYHEQATEKPSNNLDHEQPASAAGSEGNDYDIEQERIKFQEKMAEVLVKAGAEEVWLPAPAAPETGEEWRVDGYEINDGRRSIVRAPDPAEFPGLTATQRKSVAQASRGNLATIVKEHNSYHSLVEALKQIHAALPNGIRLTPTETKIATIVADALSGIAKEHEK